MKDYRKVDATHHLSSYEVRLPMWNGTPPTMKPFEPWKPYRGQATPNGIPINWYKAYNESKHNRQQAFKDANFETLIEAVAGLLVMITAQFKDCTFSSGDSFLALGSSGYHDMESSIGSLFRIKYPDDWTAAEAYDFDWSVLKAQSDKFDKIDYTLIPA